VPGFSEWGSLASCLLPHKEWKVLHKRFGQVLAGEGLLRAAEVIGAVENEQSGIGCPGRRFSRADAMNALRYL